MHDFDYQVEDKTNGRTRPEPQPDQLLKIIFENFARISSEKNLDRLLVLIADMGRELVVSDRCTVWLADKHNNTLWTKVAHGLDRITIPFSAGIVGYVANHGEPLIINDAYSDSRFDKSVDKRSGYHTRNIITIPIKDSKDQLIGVFQAVNKMSAAGIFSEIDCERLMLAAISTGKQLEAAILQEEIVTTQKEVIFTMAEIGEMRSKETGNHVKRVAEYSRLLAQGYGLSETESELVKLASPMHDIGKVGIPDAVLLKPAKLTPEEWEVMKTHTTFGYEVLKHSNREILKAASLIAYQHHEKWNSQGYPQGIPGPDIHIYGRITAIADVFDALASDRCYKKAWEMERILQLFREERGNHFDPHLIDVFFDVLKDLLVIKDTYRDEIPAEAARPS